MRGLLPCLSADVFVEGRAIAIREQLVEHVALRTDHRGEPLDRLIHSVPGGQRCGVGPVADDAIEGLSIIFFPPQDCVKGIDALVVPSGRAKNQSRVEGKTALFIMT